MAHPAAILHGDLDAFYASVEQLLDPSLRGKPMAVGSGVVLAASYEARAFGVRSGMPGRLARELCPDLIFTGGHFAEYQRLGDRVIDIMRDFTPLVERVSIDEAFLDVGGSVHLFGEPATIGAAIRERVRDEVGLPVSVGVASTKHLAKVASQVAKPDGMVVVAPSAEEEFLAPLPVRLLWGVGPVTQERLAGRGITTIGELAAANPEVIERMLGRAVGAKLGSLASNRDARQVATSRRARSVGAQSALGRRPATQELLTTTLGHLADRVASRLRAGDLVGRTVTARVRFPPLQSVTRSRTLSEPVSSTRTLTEIAVELANSALRDHRANAEVSLLGISVSNLEKASETQLQLPLGLDGERRLPGTPDGAARLALDEAADDVRRRFGRDAVGFAAVVLRDGGDVPDEFRELAERDLRD